MSFIPSHIATLATGSAIDDLRTMLKSLQFWNPSPPPVYLFCDSAVAAALPQIGYTGELIVKEALNHYTGLNRAQMESMRGHNNNLFFDFVCEKLNLLDWVFAETQSPGVLFCDADICFLAPLFSIPTGTTLAVSPHLIRPHDEARYGIYNAGMIWVSSPEVVALWREACDTSTFYEQIAIESVVAALENVYIIPLTENYGWWRLWQGRRPAAELQAEWKMKHSNPGSGIAIKGQALGSVHTHFAEKNDLATVKYNEWVINCLKRIGQVHQPARDFLNHMGFSKN